MKSLLAAAALALAFAGAAHADPTRADAAAQRFAAEAPPEPLFKVALKSGADLSDPALFLASAKDDAAPVRPRGTVQTALDYRLSPSRMASVGYLCGLQPGPNETSGAMSSFEPIGTFLGGQFKVAF